MGNALNMVTCGVHIVDLCALLCTECLTLRRICLYMGTGSNVLIGRGILIAHFPRDQDLSLSQGTLLQEMFLTLYIIVNSISTNFRDHIWH